MRKNDSNSKRGPRTSGGSAPRGTGAGGRSGKPRSGSGFKSNGEGFKSRSEGFKSRGEGRTGNAFGDRNDSFYGRKPVTRKQDDWSWDDRDERRPFDKGPKSRSFGDNRSTDWNKGGYKAARKGPGDRKTGKDFEVKGQRVGTGKKQDKYPKEEFPKMEVIRDFPEKERLDHEDRIEGRNPVFEAMRSGRPLNKLFVEKDSEDTLILRIVAMAREKNIPIQYLERKKLDAMSQTRVHQGVILDVAAQEYVEVEDILEKAAEKGEKPFLLVLDEITDTNNLGSIIRSAECAGVHGIIIPKRRSATLNATVAKVAAGALEYVPVARVTNLVQTLRDLKREGVWIIGADMDGTSNYYDADLTGACALVIGSEGEGLSRLVKDECDLMVRIPMKGQISSLNAGVAAALIMFEIAKQRDLEGSH